MSLHVCHVHACTIRGSTDRLRITVERDGVSLENIVKATTSLEAVKEVRILNRLRKAMAVVHDGSWQSLLTATNEIARVVSELPND